MYDMNDLFNSRDVVGCKLNQIIGSHKYTKSNVCTGAGISRPTLDKLLNGEVTNKTNFEKHISKLLAFLSLTPSELMGGIANPFTDSKTLRDALRLDLQQLSQRCGLSIDELQKLKLAKMSPRRTARCRLLPWNRCNWCTGRRLFSNSGKQHGLLCQKRSNNNPVSRWILGTLRHLSPRSAKIFVVSDNVLYPAASL